MLSIFGGFNKAKCQSQLIAAGHRISIRHKKENNLLQVTKREVGAALRAKQYDLARIKVGELIIGQARIEAEQLVAIMLQALVARMDQLAKLPKCPDDTVESVHTVLWATGRMSGVPELSDAVKQLQSKYGKEFCAPAALGSSEHINATVRAKLSMGLPDGAATAAALTALAKELGIEFDAERDLAHSLIGLNKGSGAASAGGGGVAAAAAPAAGAAAAAGGTPLSASGALSPGGVQNVVVKHADGSVTTITIVPGQPAARRRARGGWRRCGSHLLPAAAGWQWRRLPRRWRRRGRAVF